MFARLVTASGLSNLADGVFLVALPLVTLGITRDPAAFASVTLVGRLPWLFFALPAGALADRLDRRRPARRGRAPPARGELPARAHRPEDPDPDRHRRGCEVPRRPPGAADDGAVHRPLEPRVDGLRRHLRPLRRRSRADGAVRRRL